MKLYQTIINEKRKQEGQGGNEYLITQLKRGNKNVYDIYFDTQKLTVFDIEQQKEVLRLEQKGKCNHESTLLTHDGVECADCHLPQNKWNIKGKQKKDEVIEWYKENTGKSPDCPHYINSDKYNPDGWKFCTQCKKGKQKKGDRLGLCHCGYPCLYGTDYCERHQTP